MTTVREITEAFAKFDGRRTRLFTTDPPIPVCKSILERCEQGKSVYSGLIRCKVNDYAMCVGSAVGVWIMLCHIPLEHIESFVSTSKDVTIKTKWHTYRFIKGVKWSVEGE